LWQKGGVNASEGRLEPKLVRFAFPEPLATVGKEATDGGINGESARNAGFNGIRGSGKLR
jgi:hypothetical protein